MMPNHLHLIFQLGEVRTLEQVMHSFASFTANQINSLLQRSGSLWQSGYYDHGLRDDDAFNRHVCYIAENPVRAGFVQKPEDWPFSMIEFFGVGDGSLHEAAPTGGMYGRRRILRRNN